MPFTVLPIGYMYIEDCPSIPVSKRDLSFSLKLRHVQSSRLLHEGVIGLEEHQRAFPGTKPHVISSTERGATFSKLQLYNPGFLEDNLCNGAHIAGSYRGGLIEFESLQFEFNSRLPDFATGEGFVFVPPALLFHVERVDKDIPFMGTCEVVL